MMDFIQPLVLEEVDLQDFAYMPLDVRRLRDSDLASLESPEACWAAVLLWSASWHQVPAASLPDDDRVLANLAGYGRVVKEWKRIREGALRGWIKCSDGRLYHPVVAEKAREAWEQKLRHAHGKFCERSRKMNKQRTERGLYPLVIPDFDAWNSAGRHDLVPPEIPKLPLENKQSSAGIPTEKPLKGEGTERNGTEEVKDIPLPSVGVIPSRPKVEGVSTRAPKTPNKNKSSLPENFSISDRVRDWAKEKGFDRLDDHLESFVSKCKAKGYAYIDWDEAFMGAIRDDWGKLRVPNPGNSRVARNDRSSAAAAIFGTQKQPEAIDV